VVLSRRAVLATVDEKILIGFQGIAPG